MRALRIAAAALLTAPLLVAAWVWHVNFNDGVDVSATAAPSPNDTNMIARGAYLARAGNCISCHTARGGEPSAGGRPIDTPFGTLYTPNLTPDRETGLGNWSAAAFWRALHHGRAADGRLLAPAFPYTHTTAMTRTDVDALYAYFRSLAPVHTQVPANALRWPYSTQAALAVWRALYFRAGQSLADPGKSEAWNRGAYLTYAVAHCSACHASRDSLAGADWRRLDGGLMPAQGWYAPSLLSPQEAGVADWPVEQIARLLGTGSAAQGQASGPMAEVVMHGIQYLTESDLQALATYLKDLPQHPTPPRTAIAEESAPTTRAAQAGAKLYEQHCAACHGDRGQGITGAYPPLAGSRAVTMPRVDNLLQTVLFGGFGTATAGHPRPFGMPPFALTLSDTEIAQVLSFIRGSWGNRAGEVTPLDVNRLRAAASAGLRAN